MVTSKQASFKNQFHSDWYFVAPTLSATVGIIFGLVIANFLGWV